MSLYKQAKDQLIRLLLGGNTIPSGLLELVRYSKSYGPIKFTISQGEEGLLIAESENFRYGVIITSAKNDQELDRNIKDAILTSFEIPSSYAKEARIVREGGRVHENTIREYAVA